jgi:DNA-binding GntR family transcriptional regulator
MSSELTKSWIHHGKARPDNLADRVYQQIKDDLFEFRLLPGTRFTETEVSQRMSASRTPVRQALYRLQREGYLEVYFRNGWRVRPFDFDYFEELYDVRIVLEMAAIERLCQRAPDHPSPELAQLKALWIDGERQTLGQSVAALDEQFHCLLMDAAGNREMARLHRDLNERIRIIRRLDFTKDFRVDATYQEHAEILKSVFERQVADAQRQLRSHIELSKAEVRKITWQMLQEARERASSQAEPEILVPKKR